MKTAEQNPFSTRNIDKIPFIFPKGNIKELYQSWIAKKRIGMIIGPHGTGKSTLLKSLKSILHANKENVSPFFFNEQTPCNKSDIFKILLLQNKAVLIIDGFEQIPIHYKILINQKIKRLKGFIATAHQKNKLPTLLQTHQNINCLQKIVHDITKNKPCDIRPNYLENMFNQKNGNIRDCLFQLYDDFSNELI